MKSQSINATLFLFPFLFASTAAQEDPCPENFILNPKDQNETEFLKQFKPCGWYKANCSHKFDDWFEGKTLHSDTIKANVDYPGYGEEDLMSGVYLTEFDIGLDEITLKAYNEFPTEEISSARELINVTRTDLVDVYNTEIADGKAKAEANGELCIETFAETRAMWGKIEDNKYDCMGVCGPSCMGTGTGKDCMKHDVCSWFKSAVLNEKSQGFCADFDCGDEAAQTIVNCWIKRSGKDTPVICDEKEDKGNSNFYSEINPAAKFQGQKQECTLRTGWHRNQGMPWQRHENGEDCNSPDDCISRRCDGFPKGKCEPRLENGQRCNEDGDCISYNCKRTWKGKKCFDDDSRSSL